MSKNEELGRIACPEGCGCVASVYQAKRKGAHLYYRCPECGLNQQTGKRIMQKLYWLTDWNNGKKPPLPEGATETKPDWLTEKTTEQQPKKPDVTEPDYVPDSVDVTENLTEKQPKSGLKAGVGLLLIVAALGGAVWKM